ncbi:unnamed protein product [Spirodela intermedia]|uniref:Ferredoxin--nitrite reductase, chloroplastic n=1 Tax=Spirodela intermedia TaxID=51605 RepID=A0A7I8J3Y9_SPIIN|nr:unnamed protein product [Spirodela intermedia]CAA6664968.1 unnamed protein product [Spirodela intermedia]
MSSSAVHFPTPSWQAARRRRRRVPAVVATATPTAAPAAPQPPAPLTEGAEASRLEPRVERREGGYWVLKEKFRQGINPQEKVKLEKEPMSLFMEGGIRDLAATPLEDIEASKLSKDDIDVRLKWLGLFHRRKQQYGRFMMRLKLPNGVTTSEQIRYLAGVIEAYGEEGCGDVTTRQNWQIRGVQLPDVPGILDGLAGVGLSSLQSGMDNVRNAVGNPLAGFDPHEIVDTRPYANLLSQFITGNDRGNPAVTNLPRKWNACVVGSHDLYEHPHINDLAYMPATKEGRFGFNLLVGGGAARRLVPGDDVVPVCRAVLEAYRDLGTRGNRQKTRMMWLIDELGIEAFRAEELVNKDWLRRDYLGVHPQKQQGLCFVGLHVPVGRVQAADMFELARIADEYGTGELRLTVEQNVVIRTCRKGGASGMHGNQFCGQAIIETKARAMRVAEEAERRVSLPAGKSVRMHWTGCPNSCAQVQVADIGFMGCMARDAAGKVCEAVDIYLGGRVGSDSHLGSVYKKGVPCKDLVPVLVDILVEHFGAVPGEREED